MAKLKHSIFSCFLSKPVRHKISSMKLSSCANATDFIRSSRLRHNRVRLYLKLQPPAWAIRFTHHAPEEYISADVSSFQTKFMIDFPTHDVETTFHFPCKNNCNRLKQFEIIVLNLMPHDKFVRCLFDQDSRFCTRKISFESIHAIRHKDNYCRRFLSARR